MSQNKVPMGAQFQIGLLIGTFPAPKWESRKNKEMLRLNGAWNEKWEQKEKKKVLDKINENKDYLLQVCKDQFSGFKKYAEKKGKDLRGDIARVLIAIGSIGTLGSEELLLNPQIMDEQFIRDIIEIVEESEFREEGAYALLGLELALKTGRFVPHILDVFDETLSLRLARHLGKINWDARVIDSLIRATSYGFLQRVMVPDRMTPQLVDGVGLLSALSLLELQDERGLRGMVLNLLQHKEFHLIDTLLLNNGNLLVPYIIEGLKLDDHNAQEQAAKLLGEIGDMAATQPLLAALGLENKFTVAEVAKALGKLKDPEAIPGLLQNLGHKSLLARTNSRVAIKALKKYWTPEPFIEALATEDDRVVLYAIDAISRMKSKQAIDPLTILLNSESKKVRKLAEKAIKRIK